MPQFRQGSPLRVFALQRRSAGTSEMSWRLFPFAVKGMDAGSHRDGQQHPRTILVPAHKALVGRVQGVDLDQGRAGGERSIPHRIEDRGRVGRLQAAELVRGIRGDRERLAPRTGALVATGERGPVGFVLDAAATAGHGHVDHAELRCSMTSRPASCTT